MSSRRGRGAAAVLILVAALALAAAIGEGKPKQTRFVASIHANRATLWAVGDGDGGEGSAAVTELIAAGHPDRFLYLGDVYPNGTLANFADDYDPTFGRFNAIAAPTPGNHEWRQHGFGYVPYWKSAKGRLHVPRYYAFRAAGWQVISLNTESNHSFGSEQAEWLRDTLRSSRRFGNCRIVFQHRPRFSAGTHGNEHSLEPLWKPLRGHVRIALAGHDHSMLRLKPRHGTTIFIAGSGGHGHATVNTADQRLAFSDDSHYGALRLGLHRTFARVAFFSTDSEQLDVDTVHCKPGHRKHRHR